MSIAIRKKSSSDLHYIVCRQIALDIFSGKYTAGSLLPKENDLSESYGVSRTILREVLKSLSSKDLITIRPKVGSTVNSIEDWNYLNVNVMTWILDTDYKDEFLKKFFIFRQEIEPTAAYFAAQNASLENLNSLDQAYNAMNSAKNIDEWVEADILFHRSIYDATNIEFYWTLGKMLVPVFKSSFNLSSRQGFNNCINEHEDVYKAILSRDKDAARKKTEVLLSNTEERF